jgi:cell pole-organizing protein PopZ
VAVPAEDAESMLSPETQTATAGSLSEVAKAVASNRQGPVQVGDGRTLEDIVREALTPELKAWLDANLAPLVEQIVREEIKKMVRRAEDQ